LFSVTGTPSTEIYILSLHDALPICPSCQGSSDFEQSIECGESQLKATTSPYSCGGTATNAYVNTAMTRGQVRNQGHDGLQCLRRSEEHTSELQSPYDLVCRLLLEKK